MVATSWVVFVFEAAKMLSAEDLKILVAAKEARMLLEALLCSAPSVLRQLLQRLHQQTRLGRRLRVIARNLVIFCACRQVKKQVRLQDRLSLWTVVWNSCRKPLVFAGVF